MILVLITALSLTATGLPDPFGGALWRLAGQAATQSADRCHKLGVPPRGTSGYVFGTSDRQIVEAGWTEGRHCLAALWHPRAHAGAIRLIRAHAPWPRTALAAAAMGGLCRGAPGACAVARCAAVDEAPKSLACFNQLKGPAANALEVRRLAAVAKVRLAPDAYPTLIDARQTFRRLVATGSYDSLADLALVEYRLTNLEAAYGVAIRGAAYRLPAAEALAAYLKVEGFGPAWDLPGAYDLARDAADAGTGEGEAILSLDLSYLLSPHHYRMLQEEMVRRRLHPGPVDGHFRDTWFAALNRFTKANQLPNGINLSTLKSLGLLKTVSDSMREQRVIRRY